MPSSTARMRPATGGGKAGRTGGQRCVARAGSEVRRREETRRATARVVRLLTRRERRSVARLDGHAQ